MTQHLGTLEDAPPGEHLSDRLANDGYVLLRGALDASDVAAVRQDLLGLLAAQGVVAGADDPTWTGATLAIIDDDRLYASTRYQALCESAATVDVLSQVLGEPALIHRNTNLRYGLPQDDLHVTPAHQDHFFIGPDSRFVTFWVPLLRITPDMGGLAIAPGSHRAGLRPHEAVPGESVTFRGRPQQGVPLSAVPEAWCTTTYEPGDVLVFDSCMVHRALPNASTVVRLSVDARAQPARLPLTWQASHSILEARAHRAAVAALVGDHDGFEAVVRESMRRGIETPEAIEDLLVQLASEPEPR